MPASPSTVTLQVRPLPAQRQQNESLQAIASQMHHKYKGFRHITEEGLRIAAEEAGLDAIDIVAAESTEGSDAVQPEERKGSIEFVAASRENMMKQLHTAMNDTLILVDFVSLLTSKYKQHPAEGTISEDLKRMLPIGALGAENWASEKDKKVQKAKQDENQKITNGWKLESFSRAADSLLAAATRLREDVQKETRYWSQVLEVQQEGWTLFKSPMERTQLGVQTASIEAGPLFREQGLVTLKADKDGHIRLKHLAVTEPKMIRVRIKRRGKVVSTSRELAQQSQNDENRDASLPLGTRLRHARDSLFEEELFHEMQMEARNLVPYGVEDKTGMIHMHASPQPGSMVAGEVLVDLVSQYSIQEDDGTKCLDDSAQTLALALRLLLSNYHQIRLRRRTNKGPPTMLKPRPEPVPLIIMPLLSSLRHRHAMTELEAGLQSLCRVLQNAGLSISFKATPVPALPVQPINRVSPPSNTASLSLRKSDCLEILFPSDIANSSIKVVSTTCLIDPPLGTAYSVHIPPRITTKLYPASGGVSKRFQILDVKSLFVQICFFVQFDLLHNVLAVKFPGWKPTGKDSWLSSAPRESAQSDGVPTNQSHISVRLAMIQAGGHPDPGTAKLEVYRTRIGNTNTSDVVQWTTTSTKNENLVDVVARWIQDTSQ